MHEGSCVSRLAALALLGAAEALHTFLQMVQARACGRGPAEQASNNCSSRVLRVLSLFFVGPSQQSAVVTAVVLRSQQEGVVDPSNNTEIRIIMINPRTSPQLAVD